jgi:hypothetical protein
VFGALAPSGERFSGGDVGQERTPPALIAQFGHVDMSPEGDQPDDSTFSALYFRKSPAEYRKNRHGIFSSRAFSTYENRAPPFVGRNDLDNVVQRGLFRHVHRFLS